MNFKGVLQPKRTLPASPSPDSHASGDAASTPPMSIIVPAPVAAKPPSAYDPPATIPPTPTNPLAAPAPPPTIPRTPAPELFAPAPHPLHTVPANPAPHHAPTPIAPFPAAPSPLFAPASGSPFSGQSVNPFPAVTGSPFPGITPSQLPPAHVLPPPGVARPAQPNSPLFAAPTGSPFPSPTAAPFPGQTGTPFPSTSATPFPAGTGNPFPTPKFEHHVYRAPKAPKMKFFGFSTLIFIFVCIFAYYKYDEYQKRPQTLPPVTKPGPKLAEVPISANPLNSLKKAKDIIQKAGDTHKAAYQTVAEMDAATASGAPTPADAGQKITAAPPAVTIVNFDTSGNFPAIAAAPTLALVTASRTDAPTDNILATSASVDLPKPSAAFLRWAERLQIRGMRFGESPRVFIGNIAYRTGEYVEPQLGIVFDSYDPETRFLSFKERSGAIIAVKH